MKTTMKITLALVTAGAFAVVMKAQDAGQPGPGQRGHRPPPPPLVRALDMNHDGIIDADEIASASAALLTLDKNGDGKLTPDEFAPPRPPRHGPGTNDANFPPDGRPDGPPPGPPPGYSEPGADQPPAGPSPGPGPRGRRPQMPLIQALDANHDGVIDAEEIANAPAALRTLDKNGDGKLTPDEFAPPRPLRRGNGPNDGNPPPDDFPAGPPPGGDQ